MSFEKLVAWSQAEFSHLPWRKNRNLYRSLVAEIMLQQTTVGTVKNHFEKFLNRFPDLKSLAQASEAELLAAWKGLGYYRRAKNLKRIAEALLEDYQGEFPTSSEELRKIPGIGPYTAEAIRAIGMNQKGLALDANLERVLARFYGIKEPKGTKLQKKLQSLFLAGKILPTSLSPRALNEALMDLGRTFCQARKASCELCPLSSACVARKSRKPLSLPVISTKSTEQTAVDLFLVRFLIHQKGKILVYQKQDHQWLAGQYELPTAVVAVKERAFSQYPLIKHKYDWSQLPQFKTSITRYRITNYLLTENGPWLEELDFGVKLKWLPLAQAEHLSTASLKAIQLWKNNCK